MIVVRRPDLSWVEQLYLPGFWEGLKITWRHFTAQITGKTQITLQYPEERPSIPPGYRGAPVLVKDEEGREKCVSCQLCEFICPPRAIRIAPGEIPENSPYAKVEKAPKEFWIDMTRCIFCGYCEEVCPEEAIFLLPQTYSLNGRSRGELLHDKAKLYEMGGVLPLPIRKWANK